ncbi:MAG TPA: hypothetical protein PKY77_12415 [Phycisphaerae bacterium]|nr:hypothetical protein [Phycisphaerae bacterium]HRY70384.1 hypothetical protein [Phycisphaerae bacterium]HSA28101.1 hypothetical protein [Phycisphaerae bacterium]
MEFRINLPVEVNQVEDTIVVRKPVPLQLVYQSGRWRAQSETPPVLTDFVESMEEAIVAGVREALVELRVDAPGSPG